MHFTSRKIVIRSSGLRRQWAALVLVGCLSLNALVPEAFSGEVTVDVQSPRVCRPIPVPPAATTEGFHKACVATDSGPAPCRQINYPFERVGKSEVTTREIETPQSELFNSLVSPASYSVGPEARQGEINRLRQVHRTVSSSSSSGCEVPPYLSTDGSACGLDSSQTIDWRHDWSTLHCDIWDDAKSIANVNNAMLIGFGLAASIGVRQGLDDDVRRATARHPERWGTASDVLGRFGEFQYQLPILGAIYAYSVLNQDEELHQVTGSMVSAYTIAGLSTLAVKGIANTDRPSDEWNGGQFGFPSFHTSSSFALASVADEYYGPKVGLPAYAMASLIAWSRIDERDHDLSDVVFGATLGYVIGKAVAGKHLRGDSRVQVLPFIDPIQGGGGLMFNIDF